MRSNEQKIVDFGTYCPKCKYFSKPDDEDPCLECLDTFTNTWSHKPVNFKEKEKKK